VAQPLSLGKGEVTTARGEKLSGKSIVIPGFEEYKLVAVPPRGSKAKSNKMSWQIFEQTTGEPIADNGPIVPATAHLDTMTNAAKQAQKRLTQIGKDALDQKISDRLNTPASPLPSVGDANKGPVSKATPNGPDVAPATPAAPAAEAVAGKQAWEQSLLDYGKSRLPTETAAKITDPRQVANFSAQHIKEVKAALDRGDPVPAAVLREYKGTDWADAALAKMGAKPEAVPPKTQGTEKGAVNIGAPVEAVAKFATDEVVPAAKGAAKGFAESWDWLKRTFTPAIRGPEAKAAAGIVRENTAEAAMTEARAAEGLRKATSFFDRVDKQEAYDFMDRMEHGQPQARLELQVFADRMRQSLDQLRDRIRALGTGALDSFNEDYFPHIWKDPDRAKAFMAAALSGRPFEGSKAFLKQRTLPTIADGLRNGFEPVSDNPVDLVLLKMREMNKYLVAHKSLQMMKDVGLTQFATSAAKAPDGWRQIDDPIARVSYRNAEGERVLAGHYYAPEPVATLLNNYLSPGLRGNAAFRGYLTSANWLNQFQLGLTAFHAGFTTIDVGVSKLALALNNLSHGRVAEAGKAAIGVPISPVTNYLRGRRLIKELMNPGSQGGDYASLAEGYIAGGGRAKMDAIYRTAITRNMVKAWAHGNPIGALLRLPFAAIEQAARPVMEHLVPIQKAGVFADLARMELDRNPNMTAAELRETMGRISDSVDNRMGQMVYDNLFWNKVAKDLGMASTRSLGWNLGTLREVAGGTKQLVTSPYSIAKGRGISYKTAYTVALPMMVGTMGAITTYLFTGHGPQELKDYFYPPTGRLDKDGQPERVALPTYMKDIAHTYELAKTGYQREGIEGAIKGPGKIVEAKLHPAIGLLADMFSNKDFYGTQIRNSDDPLVKQALDSLKFAAVQTQPFGVRGIRQELKAGAGASSLLPMVGMTPAPKYINASDAELLASSMVQSKMPSNTQTREEFERAQLKHELGHDLTKLPDAVRSGTITPKEAAAIARRAHQSLLSLHVKSLDLPEAIKVYRIATLAERATLRPTILTKYSNFTKAHPQPEIDAMRKTLAGFGLVTPKAGT
jgi:hypothetical protein